MKRKMLNVPKGGYDGMKGFTIVEFLVAGLLSVIVLIAVVSSYFTSRKLNDAANERLAEQQDLRNAATLIVRDARMAGSFGCFNMSEHTEKDVVFDVAQKNRLFSLKRNSTNKLMPIAESLNIGYQDFIQRPNALIFQYGIDDVNASAETTVVSSCGAISKPGKQIPTLEDAKKELLKIQNSDKEQNGNIARQRHVVNAYAVGRIAGEEGLFRFQLNEKGEWGNPQLLAKKIKRMRVRYIYVSGCPEDEDAGKEEQFKYTDKFDSSVTPAGVEVLLDSGNDAKIAASSDNIIYAYRINATIRGGNVCANRTL
ncbi:TPA: PilW family protein [Neisseria gonorrhoeae]|uniref:PilW family protein n=1 Tax=Neisseria gonorrhoeae TaxID=485 RepID=UPI00064C849B|nr:PilW family protein [Neisseria gonorrhoeae]KLS68461.1 pilus assembly protein PilW [Neisseria gonorrhoeae NOR_2011_03-06]KLS85110.1 pilus assembly protein PilW [Neisseria gonorrhoeae MU_NG4]WLF13739.1 PilW family protein [Neisseria gonorrhoeae]SBM84877.1 prepilin-type N-terminal cleavage/methylation domain-containing protein [Neisseria gonorrhoeae]SBM87632.1 prepilin-type N-terminal cleavage/methylation domain-containing protein [Neisseria gonorrhoeae]